LRKPYPYLFRHFDKDFRALYVPWDYKDQLYDEYESIVQGDDRSFNDYLTELSHYEAMLNDVSVRDKFRILKKGINDDLKIAMIIFEPFRRSSRSRGSGTYEEAEGETEEEEHGFSFNLYG
jgi:hypothetical protein